MAQKLVTDTYLSNIADAIRSVNKTSSKYTPATMADAILAFPLATQYNWMGANTECISSSFYHSTVYLNTTAYSTWTASTTAKALVASKNLSVFEATNMDKYAYLIRWIIEANISHVSTATLSAIPVREINLLDQQIFRRPSNWTAIEASSFTSATYLNPSSVGFMRYYNTSGSLTYTWAAAYGFYATIVAPTISSSTTDNPKITFRVPSLYTRCSSTLFSTGRKNDIDISSTYWTLHAELYRTDADCYFRQKYETLVDLINA